MDPEQSNKCSLFLMFVFLHLRQDRVPPGYLSRSQKIVRRRDCSSGKYGHVRILARWSPWILRFLRFFTDRVIGSEWKIFSVSFIKFFVLMDFHGSFFWLFEEEEEEEEREKFLTYSINPSGGSWRVSDGASNMNLFPLFSTLSLFSTFRLFTFVWFPFFFSSLRSSYILFVSIW